MAKVKKKKVIMPFATTSLIQSDQEVIRAVDDPELVLSSRVLELETQLKETQGDMLLVQTQAADLLQAQLQTSLGLTKLNRQALLIHERLGAIIDAMKVHLDIDPTQVELTASAAAMAKSKQ